MKKHRFLTSGRIFFSFILLLLSFVQVMAQRFDTVLITPKQLKTAVLREGTHRYLVYFKKSPDAPRTDIQFWNRTIERKDYNGKPAIVITQQWDFRDTIFHTAKSISDAVTMQSYYHESWWKGRGLTTYDFITRKAVMNGTELSDDDTARARKTVWNSFKNSAGQYSINWHLDLEVFPLLPYRKNVTFLIPFYESGYDKPENIVYTVVGEEDLTGYDDQKVPCWKLYHEKDGNKEMFWISKKTREVLKLEQDINGKSLRYKVKLGFSV